MAESSRERRTRQNFDLKFSNSSLAILLNIRKLGRIHQIPLRTVILSIFGESSIYAWKILIFGHLEVEHNVNDAN